MSEKIIDDGNLNVHCLWIFSLSLRCVCVTMCDVYTHCISASQVKMDNKKTPNVFVLFLITFLVTFKIEGTFYDHHKQTHTHTETTQLSVHLKDEKFFLFQNKKDNKISTFLLLPAIQKLENWLIDWLIYLHNTHGQSGVFCSFCLCLSERGLKIT